MSTNNNSIHDFDFGLICEYFLNIPRQGPGSEESTIKALSFIDGLNSDSKIADLGCGTGSQTMVLAKNTECKITALDLFPQFIEKLQTKIEDNNLSDRINTIVESMDNLPFDDCEFDLIWSEGAIYNIGFTEGLSAWRKFIKPKGYIAVTEASWLTNERPLDIEQFWADAYPKIDTIPNKIQQIQDAGYSLISAFILPDKCWTEEFYDLQVDAQKIFLEKYKGNLFAGNLVKNQRNEAKLYKKYKKYYGYVFYIARKID